VDWVERVTKLRRYTRGDERAAHKPLLLLCALGRFQHFGDAPIEFGEAEGDLNRLLEEFGPPPRPARPIRSITWPPTGCGPSARHPVPAVPGPA
jgi:putative restriction endonuclease